jgi:hypothetical protein
LIPRRRQDETVLEWFIPLGIQPDGGRSLLQKGEGVPLVDLYGYLAERTAETRGRAERELEQDLLAGVRLADVAALAKILLLSGAGLLPAWEALALTRPVSEGDLPDAAPDPALHPAWGRLCTHADVWHGLFVATFQLQGSFSDRDLLEDCLGTLREQPAFMQLLERVQRAKTQQIRTSFTLRGLRPSALGDAVEALQAYATALYAWLRRAPRDSLRARAVRYQTLLLDPGELGKVRELLQELIAFQESRRHVMREWRQAAERLGLEDARVAMEIARSALMEIREALTSTHPLDLVRAARGLQSLGSSTTMAALASTAELVEFLKRVDAQSAGGGQFERLSTFMGELGRLAQ